jgi:hypothetical protein
MNPPSTPSRRRRNELEERVQPAGELNDQIDRQDRDHDDRRDDRDGRQDERQGLRNGLTRVVLSERAELRRNRGEIRARAWRETSDQRIVRIGEKRLRRFDHRRICLCEGLHFRRDRRHQDRERERCDERDAGVDDQDRPDQGQAGVQAPHERIDQVREKDRADQDDDDRTDAVEEIDQARKHESRDRDQQQYLQREGDAPFEP